MGNRNGEGEWGKRRNGGEAVFEVENGTEGGGSYGRSTGGLNLGGPTF